MFDNQFTEESYHCDECGAMFTLEFETDILDPSFCPFCGREMSFDEDLDDTDDFDDYDMGSDY